MSAHPKSLDGCDRGHIGFPVDRYPRPQGASAEAPQGADPVRSADAADMLIRCLRGAGLDFFAAVGSREERKRREAAGAEALVALMDTFKAMSASERLAQARRTDLTEDEQLVLAAFADDPDLAAALLSHPGLSAAAEGIADSVRRPSGPWWRRLFRF